MLGALHWLDDLYDLINMYIISGSGNRYLLRRDAQKLHSTMAEGSRTPLARRDFLISCLLICCGLLTLASFTFAMYTVKELSLIKSRVSELETSLGNAHLMIPNSKAENTRSLKKKSIRNVEEVGECYILVCGCWHAKCAVLLINEPTSVASICN